MKRLSRILLVVCALWMATASAIAQNRIFEKYKKMDDVEYICIGRAMLKMMSLADMGVNVSGSTNAIHRVLIIHSEENEPAARMVKDFEQLRDDEAYEMLLYVKSDDECVTTLLSAQGKEKELIMYIDSEDEKTFIVITGNLTEEVIEGILSK